MKKKSSLFIPILSLNFALSQNAVTPLNIIVNSTYTNIGVQWNVSGDVNYNSTLTIEYKKTSQSTYNMGAKTIRANPNATVDGAPLNYNFHAGSALFLEPGTSYDLRLTLFDPEGAGTIQTITAQTKAEPPAVFTGTIKYVSPGSGGGTGTIGNPYLGLQEAANNAAPGVVFQIAPGTYSPFSLNTDGTAGSPIVFSGSQADSVIVDGGNTTSGIITLGVFNDSIRHIVIENMVIRNGAWAIDAQNSQHILVRNCIMRNVDQGYINRRQNGWEHDQTIENNMISGRTIWPQTNGNIPGEAGIRIIGNRNVVRYNSVNNFGDGISTEAPPYKKNFSMDVHNNLVHRIVDDPIEIDGAVSNIRIWRNKVVNGRMGVSVAPVFGGPCYVFRNEFMNMESSTYKMNRSPAGLVIVHNSGAKLDRGTSSSSGWQNTYFRNNVLASTHYCFEEYAMPPVSLHDDWDYNAYSSDQPGTTNFEWFKWDNVRYAKLPQLFIGTGNEQNGVEFNYHTHLTNIAFPATWDVPIALNGFNFLPVAGSPLIDTGEVLPNINDPFVVDGKPDCGALEVGQPLPNYGYQGPFLPTAVHEMKNTEYKLVVYPNPSQGRITIVLSHAELVSASAQTLKQVQGDLAIYNLLGERLYSAIPQYNHTAIDLSFLPTGIYTCVLTTNDSTLRQKLVIAK